MDYTLIDSEEALTQFTTHHRDVDWLAIDTEFIGENRYQTLLCLIQVGSAHGSFLIDTLKVGDISSFLQLVSDERITKITHAGENDYRLFYELYGTLPRSIFDTQLAAGFIQPDYPVSFQKLLDKELKVKLGKDQAISQWDRRPLSNKQIQYALDDIRYLKKLSERQIKKLERSGRLEWAHDEFAKWELESHYKDDEHREFFRNKMLDRMNSESLVMLMRLYTWRDREAKRRDLPREKVLAERILTDVAILIPSGIQTLFHNRRLPEKTISRHKDLFERLYAQPATEEEEAVIRRIPKVARTDKEQDMAADLLFWLIRHKCNQLNIAPGLLLRGSSLKKLKTQPSYQASELLSGWRKEVLGQTLSSWLENSYRIEVNQHPDGFGIQIRTP